MFPLTSSKMLSLKFVKERYRIILKSSKFLENNH